MNRVGHMGTTPAVVFVPHEDLALLGLAVLGLAVVYFAGRAQRRV